jgi:hypothetical protein
METYVRVGGDATEEVSVPPMPYRKPLRTWAGHGSGATCNGCGGTIQPHEIEYEIELPVSGRGATNAEPLRYQADSDGKSLRFHFACYRSWTGR